MRALLLLALVLSGFVRGTQDPAAAPGVFFVGVEVWIDSGEASLAARRAADVTLPHLSAVLGLRQIGKTCAARTQAARRLLIAGRAQSESVNQS